MKAEKNKVVTVNYTLSTFEQEGMPETTVEETNAEHPFVFLYGSGDLLEDFESALANKVKGDKFDFGIAYERGYGPVHVDHIVNVPLEAFKDKEGNIDDEMVYVGNVLPMQDHEGNHLQGLVSEITDVHVKMDFNHPLAGKNLHFIGEILDIRPASLEELSHGHVHGPGGHHH